MNINEQIVINKFGQDLLSLQEVLNIFQRKDKESKKKFLSDLAFLIIQSKSNENDIDRAIDLGKLKPTYTPCVKIRKGIKGNVLQELIDLPDNETEKVLVLFLSLFKIAYKRLLIMEKDNPTKWWYQDLSNENFIHRIKVLTNIKLVIRKLYNESGKETGAIISAFIPFPINLFEKNIVERQLELYAFNNLYPNSVLSLYKDKHDDTASLTVIKDINKLPYDEANIGIY